MKQVISKLLIALILFVVSSSSLFAQNTITIFNEKAGKFQKTVESKWKKEKKTIIPMSEVTHLCVEGVMDVVDQKSLKILFPNIISLDLDGLTNAIKIDASNISLNKLKVLYLPKSCTEYQHSFQNSINMLYVYDGLNISRGSLNIPFVQVKSEKDVNITPEMIGWDILELSSLNLLVSTMTYLTKHRISPILHYDVDSKDIYLHRWTRSFSIDLLKKVNHIEATPYSTFFKGIDSISLPSNIKSLPEDIFKNSGVKKVDLSSSQIKIIPKNCFFLCKSLKNVALNEKIEEVGAFAFAGTDIREITLPSTLKTLRASAFNNCPNLIEIKILSQTPPELVLEEIGLSNKKTNYLSGFKKIAIRVPKGSYETYIKHEQWKELIIIEDGVEESLDIEVKPSTIHSLIPLKSIPKITSLTIKGTLFDTDLKILHKMTALRHLDLREAIIIASPETKANKEAVSAMYKLIAMSVDEAQKQAESNAKTSIEQIILKSQSEYSKTLKEGLLALAQDKAAVQECYVPKEAFKNMKLLEVIKLPVFANTIESSAFEGCLSLKSVEMPLALKGIGRLAFANCKLLQEIKLPNTLNWIGGYAFSGCDSIKVIDMSHCDNFTHINLVAFDKYVAKDYSKIEYDRYLGEVIISKNTTKLEGNAADRVFKLGDNFTELLSSIRNSTLHFTTKTPPKAKSVMNCTIYVPSGSETTYYMKYGDSNKYIEIE